MTELRLTAVDSDVKFALLRLLWDFKSALLICLALLLMGMLATATGVAIIAYLLLANAQL